MFRVSTMAGILLTAVTAPAAEPSQGTQPEIVVYAAASLRDALTEMAPACETAAGVRLVFNFGASSDLARQIEAGNKADVFISADESWMDRVASFGLVDADSRRTLLSNRLVVVGAPKTSCTIASAADLARAPAKLIAIANPKAVPAGKYARAWLEHVGQWAAVEPRVLPGVDVRAALASVESGGAELGIVYATDAAISGRIRVLYVVPEDQGPRIRYPIAAMKMRPRLGRSRAVVAWLSAPEAGKIFTRFGFILIAE